MLNTSTDLLIASDAVPALLPGTADALATFTYSLAGVPAGSRTIFVVVDANLNVPEAAETNTFKKAFTVQ